MRLSPVLGIVGHAALLDEKLDAIQMALAAGQMEGRAPVVIGQGHVHAA